MAEEEEKERESGRGQRKKESERVSERERERCRAREKYREKSEKMWSGRREKDGVRGERKKDWEKTVREWEGRVGSLLVVAQDHGVWEGFTSVVARELTVKVARGFWWWRLGASLARLRERDKE